MTKVGDFGEMCKYLKKVETLERGRSREGGLVLKKEMRGKETRNDDKDDTGISLIILETMADVGAHVVSSPRLGSLTDIT